MVLRPRRRRKARRRSCPGSRSADTSPSAAARSTGLSVAKPSRRRSSSASTASVGTSGSARPTSTPLYSPSVAWAHVDLDRELQRLALGGQLVDVELGVADRADAGLEQRPLVPVAAARQLQGLARGRPRGRGAGSPSRAGPCPCGSRVASSPRPAGRPRSLTRLSTSIGLDPDVDADPRVAELRDRRLHRASELRRPRPPPLGAVRRSASSGSRHGRSPAPRAACGASPPTRIGAADDGPLLGGPPPVLIARLLVARVAQDRAVDQPLDRGDVVGVDLAARQPRLDLGRPRRAAIARSSRGQLRQPLAQALRRDRRLAADQQRVGRPRSGRAGRSGRPRPSSRPAPSRGRRCPPGGRR